MLDRLRRALLDELFARDGQALVSLTARHDMTRIAVAKHLKILEDARLVVSRRRGREKLYYLNFGRGDRSLDLTTGGLAHTRPWVTRPRSGR